MAAILTRPASIAYSTGRRPAEGVSPAGARPERSDMNVPLLDLKAQYLPLRGEILEAIQQVVDSCQVINGPAVRQLEEAVASYCHGKAAVGVSSGTDAILLSLMALGIGRGDEVITTPYTFFATVGCIWRVGAKPVFVDIEPATYNIDPVRVAAAVTPRTKAIIPVHLYGQMADMDALMAVANRHGLYVIEDAAQSIGATSNGRQAFSMGTVGCLSFYPSKNLGAIGDAGMVVTTDADLGAKLAVFRQHGENRRYYHRYVGGNFRMDTVQAAVLLVKLAHLDRWTAGRRANAARYDELLAGTDAIVRPHVAAGNVSIYNQYVVRVNDRDTVQARLKDRGVATAIYYPLSLHEQECFAALGYKRGDFPQSEKAAAETLALPIYPELTDEQLVYVATSLKESAR